MERRYFLKAAGGALATMVAGFPRFSIANGAENDNPDIINIINFIRAVEPREEVNLVEPVLNQIEQVHKYKFAATWLIQYDALGEKKFTEPLKNLDERQEVGAWFEVVQPMVEDAGMEWKGRFPWDWHSDVGFSIGYTPEERQKLADIFMDKFREVFGRYPDTVGSWFMDSHLLGYLVDEYNITASCNAKEQIGTDGYTLWGGYYNQGYYPSRKNMFIPAQHKENQIEVPIFRMLGNDPIWAYESFTGRGRGIHSLEPVYGNSGADPDWVKWFFKVNFMNPSLSFGYAQAGQENSFGWDRMGEGFIRQMKIMSEWQKAGKLSLWTLGDTAAWFRKRYSVTPASAITALSDWRGEGLKSVWYCCRNYRTSLFWEKDKFWIRDIHRYDENYKSRYIEDVCTTSDCTWDALPILDGGSWSGDDQTAMIRPVIRDADGNSIALKGQDPVVKEPNESTLEVTWPLEDVGSLRIICCEGKMEIVSNRQGWCMEMLWSRNADTAVQKVDENIISYVHNDYGYTLKASAGVFEREANSVIVKPMQGKISLDFG